MTPIIPVKGFFLPRGGEGRIRDGATRAERQDPEEEWRQPARRAPDGEKQAGGPDDE
jgi:hypothetical protein